MRDHPRLSVLINDDCAKILRRVTDGRDISVTEAIRRGIGLLGFIEECLRKGHRVNIVNHPEVQLADFPNESSDPTGKSGELG